ncbi:MAG TPA: XdhC family protein [Myxococcota bacterium]|nr:XdhC family protein [Myxococcota bacterium]
MRELRDILDAYERLSEGGEAGVLASVVHVEGSTYRRTGARMLVLPDETLVGLISGGCLEGDLLEHARRVRATGAPELVKYDHRGEDDIVWGLGLGCAGAVDVWLERVDRAQPGPLAWLAAWSRARESGALATALSGPRAGERRALGAQSGLAGTLAHPAVDRALRECLASGDGRHFAVPALGGDVLIEVARAPLRLALFGAGPDAIPLARIARELGWDVVVMDHRAAYAVAERFAGADVRLAEVPRAVERAGVDARTHAVVMTHHYLHDRVILAALLATPAPYIAVLGPKQRTQDLLADLEKEGVEVGDEERARVFGPAGLDIGADAPEEIALAICGEVLAFASRRPGGALRERKGPIHEPAV